MACFLIVLGLAILVAGLLWPYLSRIGLGRLPADIVIERENMTFYFPLMTCLLFEHNAEPGLMGREPLKTAIGSSHRMPGPARGSAAGSCSRALRRRGGFPPVQHSVQARCRVLDVIVPAPLSAASKPDRWTFSKSPKGNS
jgi:hypothetical protein